MGAQLAGADQLTRSLVGAADQLGNLGAADKAAAQLVTNTAQGMAPRRTGRLAASGRAGAGVVEFGTRYAPVVHWGSRRHHIRPNEFAWQAAVRTEPQWTVFYEDNIQQILDQVRGA